jgi:hypothetical protein
MTYRVMNVKTGEIVAEFNGLEQFDLAMRLADDLADDKDHKERFIVSQTLTVYESQINAVSHGKGRPISGQRLHQRKPPRLVRGRSDCMASSTSK